MLTTQYNGPPFIATHRRFPCGHRYNLFARASESALEYDISFKPPVTIEWKQIGNAKTPERPRRRDMPRLDVPAFQEVVTCRPSLFRFTACLVGQV